jgi:hypothetical protein
MFPVGTGRILAARASAGSGAAGNARGGGTPAVVPEAQEEVVFGAAGMCPSERSRVSESDET